VVDRLPWPSSLEGLRCLDVGTFDGFWAFEMERRGAAEVVALDLDDPAGMDWPADARAAGPERVRQLRATRGHGFRIAHETLGSSVKRVDLNVYDLDPSRVGRFDLVFLGALLLHLRDPVRALEAVASVTSGHLLLAEKIDARLEVWARRTPAARFNGIGEDMQWWIPNSVGLTRMTRSAGFAVVRRGRRFVTPFGASEWTPPRSWPRRMRNLILSGEATEGALMVGLLARPLALDG
jgi:tRNA (mo5U34)-methyltransferase